MAGKKKPAKKGTRRKVASATDPLSVQERLFVDEFLIHRNAMRAYRKVYGSISYASAGVGGSVLLKKLNVKAEINAFLKAQRDRTKITADRVLKEIGLLAFVDPEQLQDEEGNTRRLRDIPQEVRKAITGIEVGRTRTYTDKESGITTEESVLKYRLADKNAALGKLCKYLGLEVSISPLEALLAAVPADVAATIREALARGKEPSK